MLSTGRAPRDQSERMIYNNYVAMNVIRERGIRPITPGEILELHSILTDGTLELPTDSGRFRTAEDNVAIFDRGSPPTLLHIPPPAEEVPARIERLCTFINEESTPFVHPSPKPSHYISRLAMTILSWMEMAVRRAHCSTGQ